MDELLKTECLQVNILKKSIVYHIQLLIQALSLTSFHVKLFKAKNEAQSYNKKSKLQINNTITVSTPVHSAGARTLLDKSSSFSGC